MSSPEGVFAAWRSAPALRVGFVPVGDCAPLVMARELNLFKRYEVGVELKREVSWGSVLAKVVDGVLDAAQAPASLPFAANLSLQTPRDLCVSGLVLSLQGNAITVARALWEQAGRDARTLGEQIRKARRGRTYTFGSVFPSSSQHFLLRRWLRGIGVNPDLDVHLVTVPPDQMFPSLKLGYLDGYCVGEPWTSLAREAGIGCCAATSTHLAPLHPEKVLMVRRDFAEKRAEEHGALIAALLESCAYCDEPNHAEGICRILSDQSIVNAPSSCLQAGFSARRTGDSRGRARERPAGSRPGLPEPGCEEFAVFSQANANEPSPEKAGWIVTQLIEGGAIRDSSFLCRPAIARVFRRDIFRKACRLLPGDAKHSQFATEATQPS